MVVACGRDCQGQFLLKMGATRTLVCAHGDDSVEREREARERDK